MNIDLFLLRAINQFAGRWPFLDKATVFFADRFQYVVAAILLIIILVNLKKYLPMGFSAVAAFILSRGIIVSIIRYFSFRLRPFVVDKSVHDLILSQSPKESSMPSGHATAFFAIATAVYFYNKKWGILFYVFAFLISVARVFGGVHWPSDIFVGAIVGIVSAWLVNKFFRKYFRKLSDKIISFFPNKKEA